MLLVNVHGHHTNLVLISRGNDPDDMRPPPVEELGLSVVEPGCSCEVAVRDADAAVELGEGVEAEFLALALRYCWTARVGQPGGRRTPLRSGSDCFEMEVAAAVDNRAVGKLELEGGGGADGKLHLAALAER